MYVTFAHFTSPAWNSLITDLLQSNDRGMDLARRSWVMAMISFLSLCLGGALLSFFEHR
jgi:hypothetical protein